jgi:hypothetical protein
MNRWKGNENVYVEFYVLVTLKRETSIQEHYSSASSMEPEKWRKKKSGKKEEEEERRTEDTATLPKALFRINRDDHLKIEISAMLLIQVFEI